MIEAVDLARDPASGQLYTSPPIHVHHSQGFQTHLLPAREVSPAFADFTPLTNLWSAVWPVGRPPLHVQPSAFPLAISDIVCADLNASIGVVTGMECSYLKLPPVKEEQESSPRPTTTHLSLH